VAQTQHLLQQEGRSAVTDTVCSGSDANEADLGWALAIVTRAFRLHSGSSLAELPGGPRGYLVLAAVAQGQPRSQLALAQQLGVDKTVMTYLLDELEGASLVTRRPDPADRRARQVAVTADGSAALKEFGRRLAEAEDRVLAPLDSSERKSLRDLLGRVAHSAQSLGSGEGADRAENAASVCLGSDPADASPC
jgi:DNA-binding MarR family transcriptional regulator